MGRREDKLVAAVAELEVSDPSFAASTLRERISSGDLDGIDLRQVLIDANRLFADRFAPQYAAMFERITRPENLPALVHCTAGKDRAGFAYVGDHFATRH